MTALLFFCLGVAAGGFITWFIARSQLYGAYSRQAAEMQSTCANRLAEVEAKARSAEAVIGELRRQLEEKALDISRMRAELDVERHQRIETATRLEESYKSLEQQKELAELMKKEMTDTFNALSAAALKSSSEDFLRLASESLGKIVADTKGKLGEHQAALDGTVKPLQELLRRYEIQMKEIEENRHKTYGSLTEQLRALSIMHEQLQRETSSLVTVLRRPRVSGSWGELGLRRVVELAGMTPYCDFYEQESVSTDSGRIRPDMIVRLPNGREIVVDAKAPVDAYMTVAAAESEEERKQAIANYIGNVRNHLNALSSKSYWDQFPRSPEIVVMYLPGESFFSAAIEYDHKLIEDSTAKRVIIATPTTFIALLKAIAYGWQQDQVTRSAQEISRLGKELYERFSVMLEHYAKTGAAIRRAVESYNEGARSVESRLLPSIRKFKDLGISSRREVIPPAEIGQTAKSIEHLAAEFDDEN